MRQGKFGVVAGVVLAALIVGYLGGLFFPIQIPKETVVTSTTPGTADTCMKSTASAVVLKGPFKKEGSYAFVTSLPEFKQQGDTIEQKERSQLVLCEDEHAIGTPHSPHDDVRTLGRGRYSHWIDTLYFSTPDNSNPESNGHTYSVVVPPASPRG